MPATTDTSSGGRLLSRGEISFVDDVSPEMRDTIRRMWMDRLTGCNRCDLDFYLRDNDESTHYMIGRRSYGFAAFRRACRGLFFIRRLLHPVGLRMRADVAGLHARRRGDEYVTQGVFTIWFAGRVMRVGEVTASVVTRRGRWVWGEIVETRRAANIHPGLADAPTGR